MSERAQGLAHRFEAASLNVEETLARCTDPQLQMACPAERCTVVALIAHVARVHVLTVGWIRELLSGKGLADLTMAYIDATNESWFSIDASCSRADVLSQLRSNRRVAADFLRGLHDSDLDRSGPFGPFNGAQVSVQTLIEQILIGDPLGHVSSIEAALANPAPLVSSNAG